jgi:hypothetical protein
MAAGMALIALEPPAIDQLMLVALATRTLTRQACGLSTEQPHTAHRNRRAAGTEAGRGLSGTGWHCVTWLDWYMRTSQCA